MHRHLDQSRGVKNAGPDGQRFGAWSRLLPRDQTMELELDDSFAASLATQAAELRVTYLDQGAGEFDVRAAGGATPDQRSWACHSRVAGVLEGSKVEPGFPGL
jgi:hypothetical protein